MFVLLICIGWSFQQRNVCFGARNNQFGRFTVKYSGQLLAIKLFHTSGFVSCRPQRGDSYWGCAPNLQYLSTVVTDARNKRIFPKSMDNHGWYTHKGYTANSEILLFQEPTSSINVTQGMHFLKLGFAIVNCYPPYYI